ncbi:MAG: bck1-like resistance to osmotic shock, partial [Watsoniomyces obsoletus]
MKESVDSLEKNVETFVSNRRAEGAQLLSQIEQIKSSAVGGQAAAEQKRMQELMERLSMDPKSTSPLQGRPPTIPLMPAKSPNPQPSYISNAGPRFTIPPRDSPAPVGLNGYSGPGQASPVQQNPLNVSPVEQHQQSQPNYAQGAAAPLSTAYNPM